MKPLSFLVCFHAKPAQIPSALKRLEVSFVKLAPRVYVVSRGAVCSPAWERFKTCKSLAEALAPLLPGSLVYVHACDFFGRETPMACTSSHAEVSK